MRFIPIVAALACAFALPLAALADPGAEAKSVFDTLFAAKLKSVAGTPDRADDVALAKDMLMLADKSVSQPTLVALLCESAHDLGVRHADGYAVAVEAMTLLAQTVDEKRPAAREKLITVLSKQSTAGKADERESAAQELIDLLIAMGGEDLEKQQYAEAAADFRRAMTLAQVRKSASLDEAKTRLELALSRERTMKRLGSLQERLLKDATDSATAEDIIKLYVIELDDPAAAKPYLDRAKKAQLTTLVNAAAESIDTVAKETSLALGEWYRGLAATVKGDAQAVPFARAVSCFDRFLQLHESDDVAKVKATELRREVAEKLAKLTLPPAPASTAARSKTIDVMKQIDVKRDAVFGTWSLVNGTLTCSNEERARLKLPCEVNGAYRLSIEFTRKGDSSLAVILPVGESQVLFFVDGWLEFGGRSGLEMIDGERAPNNGATKGIYLQKGKRQLLDIEVRPEQSKVVVRATLDRKRLFEWSGMQSRLSLEKYWDLGDSKAIALGAWATAFDFHSIRLESSEKPAAESSTASSDAGTVFDFVKQFASGKSGSPGSHYTIRKDAATQWIHMHPLPHGENAGTFAVALPKVPRGSKLLMTFTTQVNAQSQDGVRFIVLVGGKEVFNHVQKDNRQAEQSINLTKFAGSTAEITLKVHCIASQGWDDSSWGSPLIKQVK